MGRLQYLRPSGTFATLASPRDDALLAAGQNAAFGAAAVVGLIVLGAPAVDAWRSAGPAWSGGDHERSGLADFAGSTEAPTPPPNGLFVAATHESTVAAPRAAHARVPAPTRASSPHPLSTHAPIATPETGAVLSLSSPDPPAPAPNGERRWLPVSPLPLQINLAFSTTTDTGTVGTSSPPAMTAPRPEPARARLETMADSLVTDWSRPALRDVSVFVSADDEALSWSLSRASPNYNRLTYREDRVDIGEFAAGVSLGRGETDLALAVVEKEQGSNLGHSVDARYVGLIWTHRR